MKKIFLGFVVGIFFLSLASAVLTNTTMLNDTFENGNFNLWTDNGATDWTLSTTRSVSPTHSAQAAGNTNDLLSDNMDMSDASAIYISFSYWDSLVDTNDLVFLNYWDGTAYDQIFDLGSQTEGQWNTFSAKITDAQYFDNGFHIYIEGTSIDNGENLWIDNVVIIKEKNVNVAPTISNISLSTTLIKGGSQLIINANTTSNGVNDTEASSLTLYCSNITTSPSITNNICSGTDATYPYDLTCSYNVKTSTANETVYCRVYDGTDYSTNFPNATYTIDSTAPSLSIISVAGDTTPSYFDTANDGVTSVNISGETGMSCRWGSSDVAYSSMVSSCTINGIYALCNFTDVASQGFTTRYISCQDSLTNENNATNNLNVGFTLDYTAPTTNDNSNINFQVPPYIVTITELDNVDGDPTTFYCTDTIGNCTPTTPIDNGGTVTFTTANRGKNYLRYYSVDDAGNTQTTTNKTININQIPSFTSATDNATTIKGGDFVNVSTVSSDADSGQNLTLFVCNSSSATSSGCADTEYCTTSATANLTCAFASEIDSATHVWYAFIYDDAGESATTNPLSGSYTTDVDKPVLTILSPENTTYSQNSVTAQILSSENLNWSAYSLNESENVTMTRIAGILWSYVISNLADGEYNITFYVNDSVGNYNQTEYVYFTVNTSVPDTLAPTITIISPLNGTYYTDAEILLNLTSNENLSWAGYKINSSAIADLGNTSTTSWNATYTFVEGTNTIYFYANDTSSNQARDNVTVYVDLNTPSVNSFVCDISINDSQNLTCNSTFSDAVGLDYFLFSYNFSGSFVNSSQNDLSGLTDELNYTFTEGNYTPGSYAVQIYLFDLAGRMNSTGIQYITILDDTPPVINNVSYFPNTTDVLDPGVNVTINTSITENYLISSVEVYYKNISDSSWSSISMTNTSSLDYNATIEFTVGNWTFYINATDAQGNTNVSQNYSLSIYDDVSQNITTNITTITSFTYSQRSSANELGYIILNTTSDGNLNYNVTISSSSSILSRFNLNNTLNQTENYTASSGEVFFLPLYVNTTALTSGLYPFNITIVSEAGTEIFEKNLNVQVAEGPYLEVSIDTYSSSVTRGQNGVEFLASVTNLGTADAEGVYLNWTLPSGFSLSSGSLNRALSNLPIGVSGTNTIRLDVSSNISNSSLTVYAIASSTNANSANDSKNILITDPLTVTQEVVVTRTSGGGGGGSSGGASSETYSKTIEVVRGDKTSFFIDFKNIYPNQTLKNVFLNISGFPSSYLQITPLSFSNVYYGEEKSFEVILNPPSYKSYEEHTLKAVISGELISSNKKTAYSQTQNIKLIIQEISHEAGASQLDLAEVMIKSMKERGFNTVEVEALYSSAKEKLNVNRHNKESYDVSTKIIEIEKTASEARKLIDAVRQEIYTSKDENLLTGNTVLDNSEKTIFYSSSIAEVLDMADAAFERGDYTTALERAQKAELLLRLEQKGNIFLFVYLYWPHILFSLIILAIIVIVFYKQYSKRKIGSKIRDYNNEEDSINKFLAENQKRYYSGKTGATEYRLRLSYYNTRLANLRKNRINLRNKRVKLWKPEEISKELADEKREVERRIKRLQELFYNEKKISEDNYKTEFNLLNNRLAEIEDEQLVVDMGKEKRKLTVTKKRFLSSLFGKSKKVDEQDLKIKVDELLKSQGVKK